MSNVSAIPPKADLMGYRTGRFIDAEQTPLQFHSFHYANPAPAVGPSQRHGADDYVPRLGPFLR